jgi:hypothetical protein
MAQEQSAAPTKTPWTKIFTAFKIALDLKKLTLAALGIFFVWVGWLALGWVFFGMRSFPVYNVESKEIRDKKGPEAVKAEWDYFKAKRASWNLMYELAGSPRPDERKKIDAGDVAESPEEYEHLASWEQKYRRWADESVTLSADKKTLKMGGVEYSITPTPEDAAAFAKLPEKLPLSAIEIADAAKKQITINRLLATVDAKFDKFKEYRDDALDETQIDELVRKMENRALSDKLNATFRNELIRPKIKPYGLLRIDPWSENRGGNPYLIVADTVKSGGRPSMPGSQLLNWFYTQESRVVLEPLFKFLAPVVYLFDSRAGFWDRLYLILIIVWTLAVWGFFGGAICRIAAVQFARNERIPLKEAILFAKERFLSYLAAPVIPLVFAGVFVLLLMIFGWIEWIPWIGDLFAGVFWPFVVLFGFIIAIVLVGLVGWPLMIATISTEGTDSFDALSRSYSYVYQAPWRYLWYSFVAVVYGAALVFFIGFMASLMVFLGKWGVSSAVGLSSADPKTDREPSYLFYYAPTSFGWRDLLISSNARFVEEKDEISYNGQKVKHLEFKPEYEKEISFMNQVGARLVQCWIGILFLFVIGFGYSFFWSASTIIYFLMRHSVDDTELEEVHLEDEELEDPFLKQAPPTPPSQAAAPGSKPGTLSLNVVEAPPPAPAPTSYTADVQPPSNPVTPAPPATDQTPPGTA